ncbi:hypothetical protein SUGI_1171920 [Cryptomeria japonica]|nr:hypothetical protein SUGI_1171920 [Cryptomeria japonica]
MENKTSVKADMDYGKEERMTEGGGEDAEERGGSLVGRFVKKDFGEYGVFVGKVAYCVKGFYRVNYEDGDREDLERHELREILASQEEMEGELKDRKVKLEGRRRGKGAKGSRAKKSVARSEGSNPGGSLPECTGLGENAGAGTGIVANAGKTSEILTGKIAEPVEIVKHVEAAESVEPGEASEAGKAPEAESDYHVAGVNIEDADKATEPGNIMEACGIIEAGKTLEPGTLGEVESNCVAQDSARKRRGRPKKNSDNAKQPGEKPPGQAKIKLAGIELSQKRGRGRPRKDAIVVAPQYNANEKKLNLCKSKEIPSEKLGLPFQSKKRGRKKKSRTGSKSCAQELDASEESEDCSWDKELLHPSAKRSKSGQRKSASPRLSESHIDDDNLSPEESFVVSNEGIEEDNPCQEASFIVSNEEVSSADETFDSNDMDIVSLSPKPIDNLLPPISPLPQSSGDIPLPDNSVPDLLSVYAFLRSFSDLLFLSPFSLDDFVGALNFKTTNSLLDSVHVSLLRALRRHLEMLSKEGNDMPVKCLRQLNWDFLDAVTWPVYLAEYLLMQGTNGRFGQKIANLKILDGEYYGIMPSIKLAILQFLCDDVMEAEEFRTKVDMRMGPERDIDADGKMDLSSTPSELFAGNPWHSKSKRISCSKGNLQKTSYEDTNSISENSIIQNKHRFSNNEQVELTTLEVNDAQDFNSDECRLCGMDGNLLCCDGCPSAYHSRCVGVSRAYLLEGAWYCPECVVKKTDALELKVLETLNGAEMFGIDPYGRVFFGSCGYLIVSDSISSPTALYRYYNRSDFSKLFEALDLSFPFYNDMRTAILRYWNIPDKMNDSAYLQNSDMISGNSHQELSFPCIHEYPVNCKEASALGVTSVSTELKAGKNDSTLDHECLPDLYTTGWKMDDKLLVTLLNKTKEIEPTSGQLDRQVVLYGSVDKNAEECESILEQQEAGQLLPVKSSSVHVPQLRNLNVNDMTVAQIDANKSNSPPNYGQINTIDRTGLKLDTKSSFKPNAYINQYATGDIAASAAASLASMNGALKKTFAARMQEHIKAFSKVSGQFYWPNHGKKTMEPPKDRCGWCISCKLPSTCRRACLLNVAACNVMAGAAKVPGGLRPTKKGGGHLAAVAAYVLHIEDCLHGLMVGPWEISDYRKYWRKRVEQASTAREIATPLLELEQNIRHIALAPGWTKHVEDPSSVVSSVHLFASGSMPTPKRGCSGRRQQKNIASSITVTNPNNSGGFGIYWWRGGKVSYQVFQQGVLPCATARQTGRQGGLKRIPGVSYAEGTDIPRKSRHYVWRAAVEKATSVAQLAVQVRYLDAYVKWEDLVSPEDHSQDVKAAVGKEVDSFRIAVVCEKKYESGEVKYMLDFGNHMNIPISILKHARKVEDTQDGMNRYWLGDVHVPLYLVKAFEERILQDCPQNGCKQDWKDQISKTHGIRKGIFPFFVSKADSHKTHSCGCCTVDSLFRKSDTCSSCEGSIHCECAGGTDRLERSEFSCYKSYDMKPVERGDTDIILMARSNTAQQNLPGVNMNPTYRRKSSISYDPNGLAWKKNNTEELENFVKNKILPACASNVCVSDGPECFTCREAYNPKLMYIGCNFCTAWFHGDAFGLNQENVIELVGFKCHRCRKKSSPICPYKRERIDKKGHSARREKLPVKRSQMKVSKRISQDLNTPDGKRLKVMHSESGQTLNEPWKILNGEEKHASIKFEPDSKDTLHDLLKYNQQIHGTIESEPEMKPAPEAFVLDINQSGGELKVFQCPEFYHGTIKSESDSKHVPETSLLDIDQADSNFLKFQHSELSSIGTEAFCMQEDKGFSSTDWAPHNQKIEVRDIMPTTLEPYPENEPLFTFTELLACENDQMEDLVDLSQGIVGSWSDGLSTRNELNMDSQHQDLMISSNISHTQLENESLQENIMDFQSNDAANSVVSDETQFYTVDSTVSYDELGNTCKVCGFTVFHSGYQCKVCGNCFRRLLDLPRDNSRFIHSTDYGDNINVYPEKF